MTIELTPTERGFLRGDFEDGNGDACSIQESSAAEACFLWLGINDPNPQMFPGDNTGWHPYPLPENVSCSTRMHLTQAQAAALVPLLQRFVATGLLQASADAAPQESLQAIQRRFGINTVKAMEIQELQRRVAWLDADGGAARIAAEQERQVTKYSPEHDDGHTSGELAAAAAALAIDDADCVSDIDGADFVGDLVSLDDVDWITPLVVEHRSDRLRQLAVAGALIASEIDRLMRATARRRR